MISRASSASCMICTPNTEARMRLQCTRCAKRGMHISRMRNTPCMRLVCTSTSSDADAPPPYLDVVDTVVDPASCCRHSINLQQGSTFKAKGASLARPYCIVRRSERAAHWPDPSACLRWNHAARATSGALVWQMPHRCSSGSKLACRCRCHVGAKLCVLRGRQQ